MSGDLTKDLVAEKLDELLKLFGTVSEGVQSIGSRLDQLEQKVDNRLRDTRPIWEAVLVRLDQVDAHLNQVDARFDQVDARLNQVDARFDQVEVRFESIEKRLDGMERRFDDIEKRLDGIEKRLDDIEGRLDGMEKRFDDIERRLNSMEENGRFIKRYLEVVAIELQDIRVRQRDAEQRIEALEGKPS
ncbi:MAG TPA: hypothetical protein VJX67_01125 [Blastocatellia bacterium]|nr:hypothetical protein [Blastocatellia bacterium]